MNQKISLLLIALLISIVSVGQNGFKYQAVLRNADGQLIDNENVEIKISILSGVIDGTNIYSEEHSVLTTVHGLIHLNIGQGNIITGDFNNIAWGTNPHFLKIELNQNNSGYVNMGTVPLLYVPYALHAKTVSNTDDADANPSNEIQQLSISNDTIFLTDGGAVKLPSLSIGFSGSFNDLADVPTNLDIDSTDDFSGKYSDLSGTPTLSTVAISGSYTDLSDQPTLAGDATGNLDAVTVKKIQGQNVSAGSPSTGQVLKWTGSAWAPGSDATTAGGGVDGVVESISVTGSTTKTITLGMSSDAASSNLNANFTDNVDDADADITNEIQDLNLSGNILTITNNGSATSIDLSSYLDNTDTQLTETQVDTYVSNNGYQLASADGDVSSTNEIQTLSILGDTISLTQGGQVTIPNKGWGGLSDDALFAVVNTVGDTVFAVYEAGVRIYVDESKSKAARGGFAVATRSAAKGEELDIFNVNQDSVRIYLEESSGKAARGGFAVATRSAAKGTIIGDILSVSDDSVRIYLEESSGKAARGGFAVATRSAAKGVTGDIMSISDDSVRIYLEESGKAARGGFAVATRSAAKGTSSNVMKITKDSTRIYVADADAGFGVENTSSGSNERLMKLTEENYFIGHQSGTKNKLSLYNTFLGYQSGNSHESGNNNIFIGYQSAFNDISGNQNIFMGNKTGFKNSSGSRNTFIGDSTGYNNTTGNGHVFIGHNAGFSNTLGDTNTFVGYKSGKSNTTGNSNSFFGSNAGYSNTIGHYNAFFGSYAGFSNIGGSGNEGRDGSYNAFFGSFAGFNNTFGFSNAFIGPYSGYTNTTGRENVFVGLWSGYYNTTGYYNTFIGKSAGYSNTIGNVSTFVGFDAGLSNTTGSGNTFIGASSGTFNTTGSDNSCFGEASGYKNTSGIKNTYLGSFAGYNNSQGDSNIFIGYNSGYFETGSCKLYIDNSETATPLIYGDFTNGSELVAVNGNLTVSKDLSIAGGLGVTGNLYVTGAAGGSGNWIVGSDQNLKKNIATIPDALNRVKLLRGVNFEWKDTSKYNKGIQMGFIAQEALEIIPELVIKGEDHYSMQYAPITAILVEAIKAQQLIIEQQQLENEELKKNYLNLEERLKAIEKKLE